MNNYKVDKLNKLIKFKLKSQIKNSINNKQEQLIFFDDNILEFYLACRGL